jgi:hypothetical protein
MKWALDLLPIGIGVALVAALTWFLLDRDIGIGKWLLAGLLLAHGWVHVMFVFPAPETATATAGGLAYPFDMGRSWLISAGAEPGMIRSLGIVVMALTLAGFALAALATMGWLVPAGWWAGLVLASAAASSLMLVIFFSPALLLGFAINAALWVLVLASVWQPIAGGAATT